MRILPLLMLLAACGGKKEPVNAGTAPVEPAPAPVAAEPEPEPEPEPPKEVNNADLNVSVGHADGTTKAGHIKRIERSSDWFADEGWSTDASSLKLSLETDKGMRDATWADVKSISVVAGKVPADTDCVYDSNWSPWMYDCTVKTTATVTLKDGSSWRVSNRHKWRFTFDDDSQVEFWLYKHPAREQDDKVIELGDTNPENYDLYTKLQERLRQELKTTLVTKVTVQ